MRAFYELEVRGKTTLNIEREEEIVRLIQLLLPGSSQWIVIDEFARLYMAYDSRRVAYPVMEQARRLGFRAELFRISFHGRPWLPLEQPHIRDDRSGFSGLLAVWLEEGGMEMFWSSGDCSSR